MKKYLPNAAAQDKFKYEIGLAGRKNTGEAAELPFDHQHMKNTHARWSQKIHRDLLSVKY